MSMHRVNMPRSRYMPTHKKLLTSVTCSEPLMVVWYSWAEAPAAAKTAVSRKNFMMI